MPSDEQLRTARAIVLQKMKDKPAIISQGENEEPLDQCSIVMRPPWRPLPRPQNATFDWLSRRPTYDRDAEDVNASFSQHAYPTCPPKRTREEEFKRLQAVKGDPFTDDKCPWTPPLSKWVPPPRHTDWAADSPPPLWSSPWPIHSPLLEHRPQSEYLAWPHLSEEPMLQEGRFRRMLGCGRRHHLSRSPAALTGAIGDQCIVQKVETQEAAEEPHLPTKPPDPRKFPSSYRPTESDIRTALKNGGLTTSLTEANILRDQRKQQEQQQLQEQRGKQEQGTEDVREKGQYADPDRKQNHVPDWLKALLRMKKERSDKVFDKDFDFGPRSKDKNSEWSPSLSPCSSFSSLPDLSLDLRSKSLKRQRHDSSTADMARVPRHGSAYSTGSLVSKERSRPSLPTAKSTFGRLEAVDVHPGQLIDPPDMVDCRGEYLYSSISDFDLSESASGLDPSYPDMHTEKTDYKAPSHLGTTRFSHRLNSLSDQRTNFMDEISAAQEAVDDEIRTMTCGLQRRLRTTRPNSPFQTASGTTILTKSRTAEPSESRRLSRKDGRGRRSYVPRCESADAFLRFVRERPEVMRRVRGGRAVREIAMSELKELDAEWVEDRDWGGRVPL